MPSTPSHPSSAARPVVPGHPRANTPAPADPARLPEGKTVLFYPRHPRSGRPGPSARRQDGAVLSQLRLSTALEPVGATR
jgi:hypothetical protein